MPNLIMSRIRLRSLMRGLHSLWAPLRADRKGNVLMILGFALIPLTFATGMAIDYSRAARLQTKLNAAADAAALSGTAKALLSNPMMAACNAARRTFLNSLQQYSSGLTFDVTAGPTITITESYAAGPNVTSTCPFADGTVPGTFTLPIGRTVKVDYSGLSANAFGGMLGSRSITIGGTASTKASIKTFIDIHIALDTSQSMGLAASNADALQMWNWTKWLNGPNSGCVFGCHVYTSSDPGYNGSKGSNEQLAKDIGIRLRINDLRDATTDMIQSAIDNSSTNSTYRFGLYRVGASHSVITGLSSSLSAIKTTASTLALGPNTAAGIGDTNLPDTMTKVLPLITARGDGSTQAQARAFFFIVTDGVNDIQGSCTYGHCTRPLDPAACQAYKTAGITVGVVYTTYLPVYADPTNPATSALKSEYANLVKKFSDPAYTSPNPADNSADIKPALEACASPNWFFEASDGATIRTAMQKLFSQIAKASTITQ